LFGQDLDRDCAAKHGVARTVYVRHPAPKKLN
jgi:hypothetical protein